MQIYFHRHLFSHLSRVPILVEGTVYLQMTWSWPDKTWNILCSYCLQWNTSQSKFRNHYFLFLFAFSILSQLFLIWGCTIMTPLMPSTWSFFQTSNFSFFRCILILSSLISGLRSCACPCALSAAASWQYFCFSSFPNVDHLPLISFVPEEKK